VKKIKTKTAIKLIFVASKLSTQDNASE